MTGQQDYDLGSILAHARAGIVHVSEEDHRLTLRQRIRREKIKSFLHSFLAAFLGGLISGILLVSGILYLGS